MTHVTHAYISLTAAIIAVALAAGATDSDTGMFLALAGIALAINALRARKRVRH